MIRVILAALDRSSRASGVFQAASQLAARFGARLHVFRAITIPPEFPAAGAGGAKKDRLGPYLKTEALDELARLAHPSAGVDL